MFWHQVDGCLKLSVTDVYCFTMVSVELLSGQARTFSRAYGAECHEQVGSLNIDARARRHRALSVCRSVMTAGMDHRKWKRPAAMAFCRGPRRAHSVKLKHEERFIIYCGGNCVPPVGRACRSRLATPFLLPVSHVVACHCGRKCVPFVSWHVMCVVASPRGPEKSSQGAPEVFRSPEASRFLRTRLSKRQGCSKRSPSTSTRCRNTGKSRWSSRARCLTVDSRPELQQGHAERLTPNVRRRTWWG